jgi:hypothetical protein
MPRLRLLDALQVAPAKEGQHGAAAASREVKRMPVCGGLPYKLMHTRFCVQCFQALAWEHAPLLA